MKFAVCHQSCQLEVKRTVVDNKKRIDSFSLFRRGNASMRLSDLPLFSSTAKNMSLYLSFKTVINQKKLLIRKSHQLKTVVNNIWSYISTDLTLYIYIVKRFSNPRKEGTPCDGDGKRK